MESVDIVIPNFQGEQLLAPCLDAVLAQTLRPARILVVDDGSTDGSAAVVARYAGVEWLPLGENRGFPAAVNAGIAASTAPLVALLNTDALPEPDWLAALVRALDDDASLSLVRLAHAVPRRDGQCRGGWVRRARARRLQPGAARARRRALRRAADRLRRLRGGGAVPPLAVRRHRALRRGVPALVGGCRHRPARSARGAPLPVRAGRRVQHAQGASSGSSRLALERRNKAWLALRGLPAPLLVPFLALVPLREAYEARAAGEGPRGWLARSRRSCGRPRAPRAGAERSRGASPCVTLLPLLLFESRPYSRTGASSSRQNARNASASRDGSRDAGRTST